MNSIKNPTPGASKYKPSQESDYETESIAGGCITTKYTGMDDVVVIPAINNEKVKSVGSNAFRACENLTNIIILDGVERIGERAPSCRRDSIGSGTFMACKNLTDISIPDSVIKIKRWAFSECNSLAKIKIPSSVIDISDKAFCQCGNLLTIAIDTKNAMFSDEDGVLFNKDKSILIRYPAGKNQAAYSIPDSVTELRNSAFDNCYISVQYEAVNIHYYFLST